MLTEEKWYMVWKEEKKQEEERKGKEEVTVLNLFKNGAGLIKNRGVCVHGLE